jgi:hypothetical protein
MYSASVIARVACGVRARKIAPMLTARFETTFDASIDTVWARVIDYPSYAKLPRVRSARVVEEGDEHPAGVGALREINVDGITFKERIVEFEPPREGKAVLAYRITESRPLRIVHDIGRMQLFASGEKTKLIWETTFTVGVPILGRLLAYPVRAALKRTFWKILRHLEKDFERDRRGVEADRGRTDTLREGRAGGP